MKILHIITSLELGGAEKLLSELLPLQKSMGNSVELLILTDQRAVFLDALRKNGIPVHVLPIGNIKSLKNIQGISNFIRSTDFQIVHTHLTHAQYWTAFSRILSRDKERVYITSEHSTFNRRRNSPILKIIDRIVYSQYDLVTCISEPTEKSLVDWIGKSLKKKCSVITNGIDLEKIQNILPSSRDDFDLKKDDIVIAMAARFNFSKDQLGVVKALALLPPKYRLLLLGDGETKNSVQELARSLQMEERVIFTGTRDDVISIFKMSNIIVHFSHFEGFGLSAVEAMASGTPLIASDIPGLHDVAEGGALLTPKGDIQKLAENILALTDPSLREKWSQRGIEKSKRYDIRESAKKYIALYRESL